MEKGNSIPTTSSLLETISETEVFGEPTNIGNIGYIIILKYLLLKKLELIGNHLSRTNRGQPFIISYILFKKSY